MRGKIGLHAFRTQTGGDRGLARTKPRESGDPPPAPGVPERKTAHASSSSGLTGMQGLCQEFF